MKIVVISRSRSSSPPTRSRICRSVNTEPLVRGLRFLRDVHLTGFSASRRVVLYTF